MAWRLVRWAAVLGGGAALAARLRKMQARIDALETLVGILGGHADRADTPYELRQMAAKVHDWWMVDKGGDTHSGDIDHLGACPCEHDYTVATTTFVLNAWPNPNPNPVAGFPWNAPPRKASTVRCTGNCILVCTKVWRGWMVVQDRNTGALQINIETFAQYHCKEPTDPDACKDPEGEELPPKPGEVTP